MLQALAAHGIHSVKDVLDRSECIRDLPARSNHVLQLGAERYMIKRARRPQDPPAEARAIRRFQALGVPTARLAFEGVDPGCGSLTATYDLAPWRPLDDLLSQGRLSPLGRRRTLRALAAAVAALHDARRHHRDLYLNHVFVDPEGSGRLALIDLERSGPHRRTLGRRVVKDLAALLSSVPEGSVSDAEQRAFLGTYLALRAQSARAFARLAARIERKAERIRARVPRTPVGEAARPKAAPGATA